MPYLNPKARGTNLVGEGKLVQRSSLGVTRVIPKKVFPAVRFVPGLKRRADALVVGRADTRKDQTGEGHSPSHDVGLDIVRPHARQVKLHGVLGKCLVVSHKNAAAQAIVLRRLCLLACGRNIVERSVLYFLHTLFTP